MNIDYFHKHLRELYLPPEDQFTLIDVPETSYAVIDGKGNPDDEAFDKAIKWLFSLVHLIKPQAKERMGKKFVEPPLECLFWAIDEKDFASRNRDKFLWRVMIVVMEEWLPQATLLKAITKVEEKLWPAPESFRLEALNEGKCVQIMHIGDYEDVGETCGKLYTQFLPEQNLVPRGYYHEIYLNDPARTAPEKRKIVIRQPVKEIPR